MNEKEGYIGGTKKERLYILGESSRPNIITSLDTVDETLPHPD